MHEDQDRGDAERRLIICNLYEHIYHSPTAWRPLNIKKKFYTVNIYWKKNLLHTSPGWWQTPSASLRQPRWLSWSTGGRPLQACRGEKMVELLPMVTLEGIVFWNNQPDREASSLVRKGVGLVLSCFQIFQDALNWSQIFFRDSQMCSRCAQMCSRCPQMFSDVHRCFQMIRDVFGFSLDIL